MRPYGHFLGSRCLSASWFWCCGEQKFRAHYAGHFGGLTVFLLTLGIGSAVKSVVKIVDEGVFEVYSVSADDWDYSYGNYSFDELIVQSIVRGLGIDLLSVVI